MPPPPLGSAIACLLAFLSGSIPMALLLGRMKGIDLREHGSRNVGATNAFRVLGKGPGLFCLAFDIAKGWAPAFLLSSSSLPSGLSLPTWTLLVGVCAILGHTFSPFLKFKGGKGVATSVGAFLAATPTAMLVCFAVGISLIALTGYVSVASIVGATLLPIAVFAFAPAGARPGVVIAAAAAVGLFVIVKHRANIGRLRNGTESRIFRGLLGGPLPAAKPADDEKEPRA